MNQSELERMTNDVVNTASKSTCFLTLGQYLSENKINGVKSIDYKKTPLCEYTTKDGEHRTVKGIVLLGAPLADGTVPQLAVLGTSERLGSNPIDKVAAMLSACRVRKDTVIKQDDNQEVVTTYWCLCSPGETETAGTAVSVNI